MHPADKLSLVAIPVGPIVFCSSKIGKIVKDCLKDLKLTPFSATPTVNSVTAVSLFSEQQL